MNIGWLLDPVSEANPCGPNLDEANDPDFVDYYFDAVGRLPERYIDLERSARRDDVREVAFDPASVDLRRESARIEALLRRSRDIRLVVLQAQWEFLAGRLVTASDTVHAVSALIEQWGDAVHPRIDDSSSDRRAALADLTSQATVLQPLLHASLNGSDATLRRVLVAAGTERPRSYESDVVGSNVLGLLASRDSRKEVVASHEALGRIAGATVRIQQLCLQHPRHPFSPELDPLRSVAEQAMASISSAVPELAPAIAPAAPEPEDQPVEASAEDAAVALAPAVLPVGAPANHEEAQRLLLACEHYFVTRERSSPALILVRQALELWGRPLVEAMEILFPEQSSGAKIDFGPSGAFQIPIERMRRLSPPSTEGQPSVGEDDRPSLGSRAEAILAIRGVEAFFEAREPSSPVPLLLSRARSLLDKSFEALMRELLPKSG